MTSNSRRTPLERVEYILIVSSLLLLVVFTLQPLLNLLALSFTDPSNVAGFSGLSIIPDGLSTDVWMLLLQHPNVQRGLFKAVIGMALVLVSHFVSKRLTGKGVW